MIDIIGQIALYLTDLGQRGVTCLSYLDILHSRPGFVIGVPRFAGKHEALTTLGLTSAYLQYYICVLECLGDAQTCFPLGSLG